MNLNLKHKIAIVLLGARLTPIHVTAQEKDFSVRVVSKAIEINPR